MSDSSSDKAPESKRPEPRYPDDDPSNSETQSDYYYDDSTGYEIYEDEDDEDNHASED